MQNQNNFKKHEQLKKKLKIVGIIMVATGLALTIAGFVDFFKTMANPENNKLMYTLIL